MANEITGSAPALRAPDQGILRYWPWWCSIIACTFSFTASRLNEAGFCIGG
jgi:hypothetical protein